MVLIWAVVVAAALAISSQLLDRALTTEDGFIVEPESAVAARLTETRLAGSDKIIELVLVTSESLTVDDPAFRESVESLTAEVSKLAPKYVESVFNYYVIGDESMVSSDRDATIINVVMAGGLDEASENVVYLIEVAREAGSAPDFETYVVGPSSIDHDFVEVAKRDVLKGEIIGVGIALIILILVFRTVGAAPIPIVMAIVSVIIALALTSIIGQIYRLSFFIVNMITMIGLAVGIDYSLFIVGRYREERAAGLGTREAVTKAGATAARAVFFSGITVVLALVGMLVVPASVFFSLGLGAILVAVIAVLAALTLLPAILSLVGDRVDSLRLPSIGGNRRGSGRFWIRITRMVMTRPLLSLVLSGGLLVAATAPVLDLNLGALGIDTLPDSMASKRGFQVLESEFSAGLVSPASIVVDGDVRSKQVRDGIDRLISALGQDPGYGEPRMQANEAGNLAVISIPFNTERYEGGGVEGVRHLRAEHVPNAAIPADVYVGGSRCRTHRLQGLGRELDAAGIRVCPGSQLHSSNDCVSISRRANQGDFHESALGRRRLRLTGARVSTRHRGRSVWVSAG